jgi:hypothetical protein
MLAHALRDLFMREAELFDQPAQTVRFFDGVEVGALQVFDEAEHELFIVPSVAAHDRGHSGETCEARGSPTALTRDELITVGVFADEQRLQDAVQPDGFRELAQWFGVESRPHLLARGADLVDRDHLWHQGLAFA